jgi:predicted esterase
MAKTRPVNSQFSVVLRSISDKYLVSFFWFWAKTVHPRALFAWLISHQPAVLFSQNKPATSNQPTVLYSQNKPAPNISHQPNEQAVEMLKYQICECFVNVHQGGKSAS